MRSWQYGNMAIQQYSDTTYNDTTIQHTMIQQYKIQWYSNTTYNNTTLQLYNDTTIYQYSSSSFCHLSSDKMTIQQQNRNKTATIQQHSNTTNSSSWTSWHPLYMTIWQDVQLLNCYSGTIIYYSHKFSDLATCFFFFFRRTAIYLKYCTS